MRADAKRVEAGNKTKPLYTKPQREARRKKDLAEGRVGLSCESCGAVRPKKHFRQLGRNPVEWDSVCLACRSEERKRLLQAEVEERAIEKQQFAVSKVIQRRTAKQRAVRQRQDQRAKRRTTRLEAKGKRIAADNPEAAELARRELIRRHLIHFTQRFEGLELLAEEDRLQNTGRGYHAAWFHRLICRRLQRFLIAVVAGEEPREMFFMPPRHGKSTVVSRMFPPWALGHYPWLEFISASYGASLPMEFSRYVRTLVTEKAYRVLFPKVILAESKKGLEGWGTTQGGQYLPAGVGTGIGGRGAHILNIDDPVANQEEADSPAIQSRNLDWYFSVAQTRLAPRSGVLVTQTLWNEMDISQVLESQMNASLREIEERLEEDLRHVDQTVSHAVERSNARRGLERRAARERKEVEVWNITRLPAIAEADEYVTTDDRVVHAPEPGAKLVRRQGEALHPERYPLPKLERIRKSFVNNGRIRAWHALYQQNPTPKEGAHFSETGFNMEPMMPAGAYNNWTLIQTWDLAITEKTTSSWVVGGTGALDPHGILHMLHMRRFRGGPTEIVKQILDEFEHFQLMVASGVWRVGLEHGHISLSIVPSIEAELEKRNKKRGRKHNLTIPWTREGEKLIPVTDKILRAKPSEDWHEAGKIRYPSGAPWVEVLKSEHLRFPNGIHDDTVDFMSWMVRLAQKAPIPRDVEYVREQRYHREGWRERLERKLAGGAKSYMAA